MGELVNFLAANRAEFVVRLGEHIVLVVVSTAVAAAIRPAKDVAALGTVSVAGPSVRMTEKRVHELAPVVMATADELASMWPLRLRAGERLPRAHVAQAA